jgi:hypothetical protein
LSGDWQLLEEYVYYFPLDYSKTLERLKAAERIDYHEPGSRTGIVTVRVRDRHGTTLQIVPGDVSTVILVVEPLVFDDTWNLILSNQLLRGRRWGMQDNLG